MVQSPYSVHGTSRESGNWGRGGGGIVPDQVLQKEAAPRSLTDQFPFYILFRQKCENV